MNQFLDPLQYGWELDDGNLLGKMTSLSIASLEVLELVACKCSKGYLNPELSLDVPYDLGLSIIFLILFAKTAISVNFAGNEFQVIHQWSILKF